MTSAMMRTSLLLLAFAGLLIPACGSPASERADQVPGPVAPAPAPPASPVPPPAPQPPPPAPNPQELANQAVAYALNNGARAVVIRNVGGILVEGYGPTGGPDRGEFLASGTKSFSCPLFLFAEAEGLLAMDQIANSLLPQWRVGGMAPDLDRKAGIRLDNLLSMTAGLANDGASGLALNDVDSYAQAIGDRSVEPADRVFGYGPNSFQAALAMFQMATGGIARADGGVDGGRDPLDYLRDRLFVPLGIAPTGWLRDARGQPNFGGGAEMTARDWADFGQFLLDDGRAGGRQILPAGALGRCSSYRNEAFLPYGLGFWLNRNAGTSVDAADRAPVPADIRSRWEAGGRYASSVPESMFFAWGAGNAKMFILPSHGLVAVKIGGGGDDDRFLGILIGSRT
jgi:CubicO group peptidase (beta-lactamase class C family)